MKQRQIITTSALPYANGSIHLGHLVEYLQTDFWVRYQKMRGHQCLYICADDTHGTPIMIRAQKEGITPETLIARSQAEHLKDFYDFQIQFDHYSSTHSPENQKMAERFFHAMKTQGHIESRDVEQSYCEHDKMFLPDRFVKGTCPSCGAAEQYGDSCDKCGATYSPAELKNAHCVVCGNPPIKKVSEHLFFKLGHFKDFLTEWVPQHTQSEVSNKMNEWLSGDLRDWDISRDAPYFGFEIPGHPKKYFYVWVDAPMGYLSSFLQWCQKNNQDFDTYWNHPETEIYHFIGKDIVYFHTLFWPAMLKVAELKTPSQILVHGFLTVNGEKMSKSKGTFISARSYLDHLDPTHLRYYYACKIAGIGDLDLNLEDFSNRVNSDLIGKITNLGSRGAQMINKKMNGEIRKVTSEGKEIIQWALEKSHTIAQHYEEVHFAKAMVEIREIADRANKYFDEKAPWLLIKEDPETTQNILTDILVIFKILAIYLKPILPEYVRKVEVLFGGEQAGEFSWEDLNERIIPSVENSKLNEFVHLSQRVDTAKVAAMVEASKVQ